MKRTYIDLSYAMPKLTHNGYKYGSSYLMNLQLDAYYDFNSKIGMGLYLGIGKYDEYHFEESEIRRYYYHDGLTARSIHYGLTGKLHLLPLFIGKPLSKFDIYTSLKLGMVDMNSSGLPDMMPEKGHYFDGTIMGGFIFYFSQNVGIYAEAGYKRFEFYNGFTCRYGISVRF